MSSPEDEPIPRSRLFELLVQVDRKLAVLESRLVNIEDQMNKQIPELKHQLKVYEERSTIIQYALIAILGVAGVTVLVLLLLGRL